MTRARRTSLLALALGAAMAGAALAGCGQDATADGPPPEVSGAHTPVPANPDVAAVYLEIGDPGGTGDRLVGARAGVADRVALHRSTVDDEGTAHMEEQAAGIEVPAGQGASLEPGGLHLMLIEPEPLDDGDTFALTLEFARAGERTVEVEVTADHGDRGYGHEQPEQHRHGDGDEGR